MQELFTIFLVLCMAAMGTCRSVDFSLLHGGQTNVMNYGAVGNGATCSEKPRSKQITHRGG